MKKDGSKYLLNSVNFFGWILVAYSNTNHDIILFGDSIRIPDYMGKDGSLVIGRESDQSLLQREQIIKTRLVKKRHEMCKMFETCSYTFRAGCKRTLRIDQFRTASNKGEK